MFLMMYRFFLLICWLMGFGLLYKIPNFKYQSSHDTPLIRETSLIIPARNEERRIKPLLESIASLHERLHEVIVVNDQSEDRTAEVASAYGCKVINSKPLPNGWQGKSWACWQGAHAATGSVIMFLDADVWLTEGGLEKILNQFSISETPLSVQPFHWISTYIENLSAYFNIILMMGTGVFTPRGNAVNPYAFFGPCQVFKKDDYFLVGGHETAKQAILEDMVLGCAFLSHGIPVRLMGGAGAIHFRMYPGGLSDIIEGWSKNFASGSATIHRGHMVLISLWITGSISVSFGLWRWIAHGFSVTGIPSVLLYLIFGVQIIWMLRRVGNFSRLSVVIFPIWAYAFMIIYVRGVIMTYIRKKVIWKGRTIYTR